VFDLCELWQRRQMHKYELKILRSIYIGKRIEEVNVLY
jgi:hypothetical protein